MDYSEKFRNRVDRTIKFLHEKKPGTLLWQRHTDMKRLRLQLHWIKRLMNQDVSELLDIKLVSDWNAAFLKELRTTYDHLYALEDDSVPTPEVYFSIGSYTAMMSKYPVHFASNTGWCEPNIDNWEALEKLFFDPDNKWIRFYTMVTQDMIAQWEGDYALMPAFHRSPLDAANGLRGNDLFIDCYDEPERVQNLIQRCADWAIAYEAHIKKETDWPKDLLRGVWRLALPADAVCVNGDPVDLISEEHQAIFDRPSASRFFTSTGGGFFHHHTMGIRQVENVSYTKGLLVQEVLTDPNIEPPFKQIIGNEKIARMFVEASLRAPIMITGDFLPYFDQLAPVLEQGCFILDDTGKQNADVMIKKLERFRF